MGGSTQQYCLRWNNHRSNLLLVFEHLFQTESFTDVTLACDGTSIKCHKMVLAACSSYFQQLFMENECKHPIVILKDIQFSEIKAILEYMYKGEVNVAQDHLAGLLKAAETLKVKGLVEDHQNMSGTPTPPHPPSPHNNNNNNAQSTNEYRSSTPSFSKSNSIPSSKFTNSSEPGSYDAGYSSNNIHDRNLVTFPTWSSATRVPLSPSPKHVGGNSNYESGHSEPVPLKKKRYLGANKDTPILRTVLGHTSLQGNGGTPTEQVNQHQSQHPKNLNYSLPAYLTNGPSELGNEKLIDSPDHFMDDSMRSTDSDKGHDDNQTFNLDDSKHGLATYVPAQKPEWKRYKQYTRNDIMAAIDAVRSGTSALQAARKFGVPSRTLYDKVKKLGITTNRPFRKGSFPMSPYQGNVVKSDQEGSAYSPEDQPLDASATSNGNGTLSGTYMDDGSDKMDNDSATGSVSGMKQEDSPSLLDVKHDLDITMHSHSEPVENGSENSHRVSPLDRDQESEELRSSSD